MTEPDEAPSGHAVAPFLGAMSIFVAIVIGIWLFNLFSGDNLPDEQLIARAAAGQNDALQRANYADLQAFSCAEARTGETEVLDRQRDSVEKRGNRVIERVADVVIDGDRASADITYYFEKNPDAKETVEITFAREDGTWKVCSTGPS